MRVLLNLCALATTASGFSLSQPQQQPQHAMTTVTTRLWMSEPSDTSSDMDEDDYIIVESDEFIPTESESVVTSIMDLMPSTLSAVSSETRSAINEALLRLEAINPTPEPALSNLINGVWELKYAGGYSEEWALPSPTRDIALFLYSGGYSPGLFALTLAQKLPSQLVSVGDLEISISRMQPRIEASIDVKLFGGSPSKVTVSASLEAQSGVRLKETYEKAKVLDREVEIPKQLQYGRQMYVTFVDEEIMVVRDASGVPEVLVRK